MTFFQLSRLLTIYTVVKGLVYAACWAGVFFALVLLAGVSPKAALWVTKLAEPLSGLMKDLFWAFVPEPGQVIRAGGKLLGALGRKAVSLSSDKTQLAVQLGVLNGFLVVSISAWLSHLLVMRWVKRVLLRRFLGNEKPLKRQAYVEL